MKFAEAARGGASTRSGLRGGKEKKDVPCVIARQKNVRKRKVGNHRGGTKTRLHRFDFKKREAVGPRKKGIRRVSAGKRKEKKNKDRKPVFGGGKGPSDISIVRGAVLAMGKG